MKYPLLLCALLVSIYLFAQPTPVKLVSSPTQIVIDSKDNLVVHCYRGRMLKISPDGTASPITDDLQKGFSQNPYPVCNAMTIDTADNIYFTNGSVIWKMTPGGVISLYMGIPYVYKMVDGPSTTASFRNILFLKTDGSGNIYLVEKDDSNKEIPGSYYVIRKISTGKEVTTITNTRENAALKTSWIAGMGVDSVGNIYLSDGPGRCIKKLATDGTVSILAGLCNKREFKPVYIQGDISKAELMSPEDIVLNRKGEIVFADLRLNRIIKIAGNKVATMAGNSVIQPNNVNMGGRSVEGYKDGMALTALFNFPQGVQLEIDSKQNIYIIDGGNDCIRKLSADGMVTTIAKK